jgi:hypothetical protein
LVTNMWVHPLHRFVCGGDGFKNEWGDFHAPSLCGMLLARTAASNSSNSGGQSLRDPRSTGHWFNKFNPLKDLKVKATASSKEKKLCWWCWKCVGGKPPIFQGQISIFDGCSPSYSSSTWAVFKPWLVDDYRGL